MILMVYIASNISSYEVVRSSGGDIGYSKIMLPLEESIVYNVGSFCDVYLYGVKVFRGVVRYIKRKGGLYEIYMVGEEDIFQRQFVRRKITPEMVGKTGEMDISDVVRWLVDNYSSFEYDDTTIKDTGYKIKKIALSDKISSILNRFADAVGFVWYVKDGKFYFKEPSYATGNFEFNNSNARFQDWNIVSDKLANDVHVFGARLEYQAVDYFIGDGITTEFKLSYIPSGNIRVFVEGNEISSEEYEIDKDNQVIRFKTAPPLKQANVTAFTKWTWRRKITVTNSSGSDMTNPAVILRLNDGNFDFTSVNSDMSDIRFGLLDGTEFPYVYLGVDENGDRIFVVKLNGVTISAGGTYSFYMFYGFENAEPPAYKYSDVLTVVDEFNYDGELDANKWGVDTYWISCEATLEYYVRLAYNRAYLVVNVSSWYTDSQNRYARIDVSPSSSHSLWIYWYEQGSDTNKHIGLNVTTTKPRFVVGYYSYYDSDSGVNVVKEEQDGGYVVLSKGVYALDTYIDVPNVNIGARELHAGYNVEVRYNFVVPIYANMQDYESIEKYGRISAELRLDWVRDFDTATLIASKYLQAYRDVLYQGVLSTSDYYLIKNGIETGMIVWVNDKIHEVNKQMLIMKLKFKNGVAEVDLGEALFNVYKWGALVEHRVRQLETAGDENFFTPSWQR